MTTLLNGARDTVTYAQHRLTAAHDDPTLTHAQFMAVLEDYLIAVRAYHCTIRVTNTARPKGELSRGL